MVSVTEPEVKHLTPREKDVLVLVQRGMHHAAIANQLGISLGTVKNHLGNIYARCEVPHWANPMAWLAANANRIAVELGGSPE